MIAQIVDGELDLADILFVVALLVFGVVCLMRAIARNVEGALAAAGGAALALAWMVL